MKIEEKLSLISILFLASLNINRVYSGNPDAKRLYDDLLSNYNKLVRPVANVTEAVTVHLKLKLSQLIAVVAQIFRSTTVLTFSFRTWRTKSWPPTCGWNSSGRTTSCSGIPRSTAGATCCMFHLITSGDLTLSFTTSEGSWSRQIKFNTSFQCWW